MKLLITGALGHIGSKVIREIPKFFQDAEIIMIDNLLTQRYCSLFNLPRKCRYRFIEADILETDIMQYVKDVDVVLHLAAITDAAGSFQNRERVEKVNYSTTVAVADSCKAVGCPMIQISSTSVYGTQRETVDEDCSPEELKPQSPYAETKLKEEKYLQELGADDKFRFITFRFGTICGISPGIRFHTAVNKFCWQAVMGQPLPVWRTALHQKRPYLTIDDAVNAIIHIIKKNLFDRRIYNVLTANMTVHSIIQIIERQIPDLKIQYVDTEIMNQLSYEVLNTRFKEVGFEFKGSVTDCIVETIQVLQNAYHTQAGHISADS